jgi:purine-binding chemotaxis protein CheW
MSASDNKNDYVTVTIGGQMFGIPVLSVEDVLGPQTIARIPMAPPQVAGALNLRGRIVTAIDVRSRLGLPPMAGAAAMSVVVAHHGDSYSLLIDDVGEVLSLSSEQFDRNPGTLDVRWRDVSEGIHRLDGELLIILDVDRLLDFASVEAA